MGREKLMNSTDKIKLLIDEKAHGYAKIYASLLKDEYQRKRAYASIAALYSFIPVLEKTPCSIQKSMTLFRNPQINEQYEISDLYVNKWHLDVRVVTGGDAVLVPKIHYDSNIVPDFYVVIKVDANLKEAELIGIADTSSISKEIFDVNYYSIEFNSLIDFDSFVAKVSKEKPENFSDNDHSLFEENYLGLMDNELDLPTKNKILNHLFNCSECRTEFCCFTGFEMVSCNAVKYPEIVEDQTLTIVGAQKVDDKEYEGKEENIYIGEDEETANIQEDTAEETVSDILDELFSIDDEFITPDTTTDKDIDTELNIVEDKDDEELEIIEENDLNGLDSVEDNIDMILEEDFMTDDASSDLEVIDKTHDNILDEEFVVLDQPDDIELISETEADEISEIENITDDNQSEHGDYIEKVIVDYDETGEPVYSYITNVSQNEDDNSEIETIEDIDFDENQDQVSEDTSNSEIEDIKDEDFDNILDEEFETYDDDNSNIQNYENSELITYEDNKEYTAANDISYVEETDDIPMENYEEESHSGENIEYDESFETVEDTDFENYEEVETETEFSDEQDFEDEDEIQNFDEETDEQNAEYEDDEDSEEEYDENVKQSSPKTLVVIVSVLVMICLLGGGAFFFMKNKNNDNIANNPTDNNAVEIQNQQNIDDMFEQSNDNQNEQMPQEENNNGENQNQAENQPQNDGNMPITAPLTESDLLPPQNNNTDVGSAIANAFSPTASSVSFRGLNWFCTSELFSDRTFKAYLQNLDNVLKQNLKTNILNATETPAQDKVSAKFAVDNNGNLKKVVISESSGSDQIDNIVLQSINESFVGEKSQILNDSTLKSDMYYLKVTIKL